MSPRAARRFRVAEGTLPIKSARTGPGCTFAAVTTTRYACPADVAAADDEGRIVLLHLPSARRLVLSETASRIWTGLVDGRAPGELSASLAAEYGTDAEVVARDVDRLVVDLLDQGLLTERVEEPR